MSINTTALITLVVASLLSPALLSAIGDVIANILTQDGFPVVLNDIIAWSVLIFFAVASVFVAGAFTSLPGAMYAFIPAVFVLASTSLHSLRPWLVGLSWIQSNVFDVAKGAGGQAQYTFNATRALTALLPEIEKLFQKYVAPPPDGPIQWSNPIGQPIPGTIEVSTPQGIQNYPSPLQGLSAPAYGQVAPMQAPPPPPHPQAVPVVSQGLSWTPVDRNFQAGATGSVQAYPGVRAGAGNAFALASPTGGNGNGGFDTANITIEMDGKKLTDAVGVRMAKQIKIQGGIRNR